MANSSTVFSGKRTFFAAFSVGDLFLKENRHSIYFTILESDVSVALIQGLRIKSG